LRNIYKNGNYSKPHSTALFDVFEIIQSTLKNKYVTVAKLL